MSPEIENLMNMALASGEVTDKSRDIIMRKAEALGEDLYEVEMILEGKIALMKKEQNVSKQQVKENKPVTEKHGNVSKCPSCGSFVPYLSVRCADCDYEFKNVKANNSVSLLTEKLEQARIDCENRFKDDKSVWNLPGTNFELDSSYKMEGEVITKQLDVIRNFPVPNTLEDIYELIIFIKYKAEKKANGDIGIRTEDLHGYTDAWNVKFQEVVAKAKFLFRDDPKSLEMIKKLEEPSKLKKKRWSVWKILLVIFLIWLFLVIATNL